MYVLYQIVKFKSSAAAWSEVVTAELPILSTPETEGRNWWAGYILHMTKGLHEWLGSKTAIADNVTPWMSSKSRGGAYMPSAELTKFLETAEEVFTSVNGSELSLEKDPIHRVAAEKCEAGCGPREHWGVQ